MRSPLSLAEYVRTHDSLDWGALRAALGETDLQGVYPACGANGNRCSVELVRVARPDQMIAIVQGQFGKHNDIFLRYLKTGGGWRFAGEHRIFWMGEKDRHHEIERLGTRPFLRVRSDQTQVGGALGKDVELWFDLSEPGFEPVFAFTAEGDSTPFCATIWQSVQAKAIYTQLREGEQIELRSSVRFAGQKFVAPYSFIGIYQRHKGQENFSLTAAFSDTERHHPAPVKDFLAIGGPDFPDLSPDHAFVYAAPAIESAIPTMDRGAKQCLENMLKVVSDSAEKRTVVRMLRER